MRNITLSLTILMIQFTGISYSGEWANYTDVNSIQTITHYGDSIFIGAYQGGFIFLDAKTDNFSIYNKVNSMLVDNDVKSLAVDSIGSLYIGSRRQLQIVKGDKWLNNKTIFKGGAPVGKFTIYGGDLYTGWGIYLRKFDGAKWDSILVGSPISSSFNISDILPINKDSIWVCGYEGLYLVRNFSTVEKLLTQPVTSLLRDSSGAILCGTTYSGIKKLSGTTWTSYDTTNCGLPANCIQCMQFDSKKRLWLGTSAGLVMFDSSIWTVYDSVNSGLPGNSVHCLDIDSKDHIWIANGFYEGLTRFDGTSWKTYSFGPVPSNQFVSIAHDKNNTAWLSSSWGLRGVVSFNGVQWTEYTFSSQTPPAQFNEIYADTNLRIWTDFQIALSVPSPTSYAMLFRASNLCDTGSSEGMIRDKNGLIWAAINGSLCTYNGSGWQQVNSRGFPIPAELVIMACGYDGTMHIGGLDRDSSVLVSFDGQNWKTDYVNIFKKVANEEYVSALAVDTANNVWAGVSNRARVGPEYGSGIIRFSKGKCDTFNIYNSGLPSNTVWVLEFDKHGNLWSGGSDGLAKYDGQSWKVYNTVNSGLPHDFVNAISVDKNDNKWIGTNYGGLAVFREGGLILSSAVSKPVSHEHSDRFICKAELRENFLVFRINKSCLMAVSLYNLSGRLIHNVPLKQYNSGTFRLDLFSKHTTYNGVFIASFSGPEMGKQTMLVR